MRLFRASVTGQLSQGSPRYPFRLTGTRPQRLRCSHLSDHGLARAVLGLNQAGKDSNCRPSLSGAATSSSHCRDLLLHLCIASGVGSMDSPSENMHPLLGPKIECTGYHPVPGLGVAHSHTFPDRAYPLTTLRPLVPCPRLESVDLPVTPSQEGRTLRPRLESVDLRRIQPLRRFVCTSSFRDSKVLTCAYDAASDDASSVQVLFPRPESVDLRRTYPLTTLLLYVLYPRLESVGLPPIPYLPR